MAEAAFSDEITTCLQSDVVLLECYPLLIVRAMETGVFDLINVMTLKSGRSDSVTVHALKKYRYSVHVAIQ